MLFNVFSNNDLSVKTAITRVPFSTNEIVEESNQAINEVLDTTTEKEYQAVSKSGQDGTATGVGVTSVVFDNQYLEQTVVK